MVYFVLLLLYRCILVQIVGAVEQVMSKLGTEKHEKMRWFEGLG